MLFAMNEFILKKKTFTGSSVLAPEITNLIDAKDKMRPLCHSSENRARRKCRNQNRNKTEGKVSKAEINCLSKIIKDRIAIRRSNVLLNKLRDMRPNNKIFKNINKLLNSSQYNSHTQPLLTIDGILIRIHSDKVNVVADEYAKIHVQNKSTHLSRIK